MGAEVEVVPEEAAIVGGKDEVQARRVYGDGAEPARAGLECLREGL